MKTVARLVCLITPCFGLILFPTLLHAGTEDDVALALPQGITAISLDAERARGTQSTLVMMNDDTQTANLDKNIVLSNATGQNTIDTGAMSGARGISTLIQNSGNQVIIQNTTLVNVLFKP